VGGSDNLRQGRFLPQPLDAGDAVGGDDDDVIGAGLSVPPDALAGLVYLKAVHIMFDGRYPIATLFRFGG